MEIRKVTSKNQITLPKSMVEELGIEPGDRVVFRKLDKYNYVVSLLDEEKINSILLIDPIPDYKVKKKEK